MQPLFLGRNVGSVAAQDWEIYLQMIGEYDDLFLILDEKPAVEFYGKEHQATKEEIRALLQYYRKFIAREFAKRVVSGVPVLIVHEAIKRIILSIPFGTEADAVLIKTMAERKIAPLKKERRKRKEVASEVVRELTEIVNDDMPPEVLVERLQWLARKYGGDR